jgi:aminobenzoyl-glutamate utilization protein B
MFENEKLRNEVKAEFLKKKGNEVYVPMIPDGAPPEKN